MTDVLIFIAVVIGTCLALTALGIGIAVAVDWFIDRPTKAERARSARITASVDKSTRWANAGSSIAAGAGWSDERATADRAWLDAQRALCDVAPPPHSSWWQR